MSFSVASEWSQVVKKKNEASLQYPWQTSTMTVAQYFSVSHFCLLILSLTTALLNIKSCVWAKILEEALDTFIWASSGYPLWNIWKGIEKKNNIDFILQSSKASYISILVKCTWNSYVLSIHTYSWNSYLSNYFSTLIFFAIFKLAFTSHTTKNSRVTLSTLWGI